MEMTERELANPSFGHDLMLDGLYRCIASALARNATDHHGDLPDRYHISPTRLRRVIDYIEAHLSTKLTISELAEIADLSKYHFIRMFKQSTGQSPYQYVVSRRILEAQRLIANSGMPLADIAVRCGFANAAHFTSAFARETSVPPSQYRKSIGDQRQGEDPSNAR